MEQIKRNYFVDFSKIKNILNFDTLLILNTELMKQLMNSIKKFNDYLSNQNKYGNYNIDLSSL